MLSHKDLIRFAFTNEFVLEGGFRLDAISPPYSYLIVWHSKHNVNARPCSARSRVSIVLSIRIEVF